MTYGQELSCADPPVMAEGPGNIAGLQVGNVVAVARDGLEYLLVAEREYDIWPRNSTLVINPVGEGKILFVVEGETCSHPFET